MQNLSGGTLFKCYPGPFSSVSYKRLNKNFVKLIRDGLYELRASHNGNIYRAFFIFDDGNIVMLFNGFQKKAQKTPNSEIEKALKLKNEYYASKS